MTALVLVLCLASAAKSITGAVCSPPYALAPTSCPVAPCVDSAIVQSLVDTLQLCIVSGALHHRLPAATTLCAPSRYPVLPRASCKCVNSVQPCWPVCSCGCNVCGCECSVDKCGCSLDGCRCNVDGCGCNVGGCGCNVGECGCSVGGCGFNVGGCGCNVGGCAELVSPPCAPQLPCGCGYLRASAPLVTSAFGARETCWPAGYVPGSIPVTEHQFPYGCACSCGSLTLATPLCQQLANLAQPIIL